MKATAYTEHPEVQKIIQDLKAKRDQDPTRYVLSDIIDAEGHQYVDFVQEGGGVLGIALVGYIYVLEEMGIRFLSMAGTSAGSITTLLLAALGKPQEKKSRELMEIISNKNFYDFVDGPKGSKQLIQLLSRQSESPSISKNDPSEPGPVKRKGFWARSWGYLKTVFSFAYINFLVPGRFHQRFGLNPGQAFYAWLAQLIQAKGIHNTQDLLDKMNDLPPLKLRTGEGEIVHGPVKIAFVATDLTTGSKVVFPELGPLYFEDYMAVNPAKYVRASMSIPIFFDPCRIGPIPQKEGQTEKWADLLKYTGEIPAEVLMVDGGVLSNFPIDIFHHHMALPQCPTFGIKLGFDKTEINQIGTVLELVTASFNAASQIRDFEFIFRNPDFEQLVGVVDVGEAVNWLDFNMSDEDKKKLFLSGVQAAVEFLEEFDWAHYKQTRQKLLTDQVRRIQDSLNVIRSEESVMAMNDQKKKPGRKGLLKNAGVLLMNAYLDGMRQLCDNESDYSLVEARTHMEEKIERIFDQEITDSDEPLLLEINTYVSSLQEKVYYRSPDSVNQLASKVGGMLKEMLKNRGISGEATEKITRTVQRQGVELIYERKTDSIK